MLDAILAPWGNAALWIVGLAVKGTGILLLVLLAAAALRRASAGLRHLVWSGGVLAVLLLPIVSLIVPWQIPIDAVILPEAVFLPVVGEAQADAPDAAEPGTVGVLPVAPGTGEVARSRPARSARIEWLLAIWGAGFLFFLGRLGFGALHARRILSSAKPLESPDWTHPLIEAADRISLPRLPSLLTSDHVPMPVVCGVFKPTIVVPSEARDWTDRRRRAVLCHELAHIRRLDLPANLFGRLACAFHWFNPLVWIAVRKLRVESERACDDLVLRVGTRPSEYADHLLQIVGGARHAQAPAVAIPMAQRREFEGRMLAILDKDVRRDPATAGHLLGAAALAVSLTLPVSAMTPVPAVPSTAVDHSHAADTQPEEIGGVLGALLEGLLAANVDDRMAAAHALGTLRETGAVRQLCDRVREDPDSNVRLTAAWALGEIGATDATTSLSEALAKDAADAVRVMAAWALGQIGDPTGLSLLEHALDDASGAVRNRAVWAIGAIAPAEASSSLLAKLHDSDDDVREMAAWAIGRTRDRSAVRALAFAVGDPYPKVGISALWSLAHIGGPEVHQVLTDAIDGEHVDPKLRAAIERALAGEAVEPQPRPSPIPVMKFRR